MWICLKLTIKTPERRHWRYSGVFIVNFEHISQCPSVSIVNFDPSVSIANFEHVIAGWEKGLKWLYSGFLAAETFFLSFKMNELTNKFGQTRYAHSEPCQTPKMELFMKIVYGF